MSNPLIHLSVTNFDKYFESKSKNDFFLSPKYNKSSEFASRIINIQPYQTADFGKKVVFEIPKNGAQFVHSIQLAVTVPGLVATSGTIAGWTNGFLYALIDKVELEIGGEIIDKRSGIQMDIRDELTSKAGHSQGKNLMSGKKEVISNTSDPLPRTFILKTDFWFNNDPSQALPIGLLTDQKVKLNFYFKNFSECVVYDGTTQPVPVSITNCEIMAEYYFIGKKDMKSFVEKSFSDEGLNYLIETTVFDNYEVIKENQTTHKAVLNFVHPVKEINWVLVEEESVNNNDWFNYSVRDTNLSPLRSTRLILDGITQTSDFLPEYYFRLIQNEQFHSVIPLKYIYTYSFAREPENIDNTGSLNLSLVNESSLNMNFNPVKESRLYVFGKNYNVFTISRGQGFIRIID